MTAREKASQLIVDYQMKCKSLNYDEAKQCALIAVDEILKLDLHDVGDYRNDQSTRDDFSTVTWYINYWQEVKQEIKQL